LEFWVCRGVVGTLFGVLVTKESREKRIEVFAIANPILFSQFNPNQTPK